MIQIENPRNGKTRLAISRQMRISNDSASSNDDNRSSPFWFSDGLGNLNFSHVRANVFSFAKKYFPYKISNVKRGHVCKENS
jgi:hypothetical protein